MSRTPVDIARSQAPNVLAHNVFVGDPHARRSIVGETLKAAGNWSSYPAHTRDGRDGELRLEEMRRLAVFEATPFQWIHESA